MWSAVDRERITPSYYDQTCIFFAFIDDDGNLGSRSSKNAEFEKKKKKFVTDVSPANNGIRESKLLMNDRGMEVFRSLRFRFLARGCCVMMNMRSGRESPPFIMM